MPNETQLGTPIAFISHRKVHDIISIAWNQITWVHFSLSLSLWAPFTLVFKILHLRISFSYWFFFVRRDSLALSAFLSSHLMVDGIFISYPIFRHHFCIWGVSECECAILRYYQNDFPFVSFERNLIRCVSVWCVRMSVGWLSLFIFKTFTKFDFDSLPYAFLFYHTLYLSPTHWLPIEYLDEFMP